MDSYRSAAEPGGRVMRRSGVLLPVSSIPSKYGIGTFSKECYAFVDFLEKAGQSLWQILPLGPTGYGDSPYQSFSTFAGNPYFIDLEKLTEAGWIAEEDCEEAENPRYVDYGALYNSRFRILRKAYRNSHIAGEKAFQDFCGENAYWLDDYGLYMALKNAFGGKSWITWDGDIRLRKPESLRKYRKKFAEEIEFYQFQQYLFDSQWHALKKYANEKGIRIIGDIPIYVAYDSADVWSNPELFQLDKNGYPVSVAGCPPDLFSATGQLWGNPLYLWEYHEKTGYEWWLGRIRRSYELYDILRLDHFRGFDEYYAVPYGNPTAEFGCWKKGPGYEFFRTVKERLGKREVIAEDLGFLTPSVLRLVKRTAYPGMKVLLFAFDAKEPSNYLPHNYGNNCVVYTGTHDNDTIEGWLKSAKRADISFAMRYLGVKRKKDIGRAMIRAALSSTADTAIIPIQDYLGLDNSARMNVPSTLGNNWKWRLLPGELSDELAEEMCGLSKLYGRKSNTPPQAAGQ